LAEWKNEALNLAPEAATGSIMTTREEKVSGGGNVIRGIFPESNDERPARRPPGWRVGETFDSWFDRHYQDKRYNDSPGPECRDKAMLDYRIGGYRFEIYNEKMRSLDNHRGYCPCCAALMIKFMRESKGSSPPD
jgi:hypothetical protein